MVSQFADDINIGGIVDSEEGYTIEFKSLDIMLQLYGMLVRPFLEFCIQFWSPCYRKDIMKLERVRNKFTRMLPGLEDLSYKKRLNKLGLFFTGSLRVDFIEVYKTMRGTDKVNSKDLFPRVGSSKLGSIIL
eukprot:g41105.t1